MKTTTAMTITFYECEHDHDLSKYASDVVRSGGRVVAMDVDMDAEIGRVRVEVDDRDAFLARFRTTLGFESSSLWDV